MSGCEERERERGDDDMFSSFTFNDELWTTHKLEDLTLNREVNIENYIEKRQIPTHKRRASFWNKSSFHSK